MADDFRVQRRTLILAIIMAIFLIFSILSFFGVFNITEYAITSYCILPKSFTCSQLKVTPDSVSFMVQYTGASLKSLSISIEGCPMYQAERVNRNSNFRADFSCQTGSRGRTYKVKPEFTFMAENALRSTEAQGKIKAEIESNI